MAQGQMPPQEMPPQGMAGGGYVLPEDQGIATLPVSNMDFANGGIVAFADGGSPYDAMALAKSMVRDDEDESDTDYLNALMPSSMEGMASMAPTTKDYGAFGEEPIAHTPVQLNASRMVNQVSEKEAGKPAKIVREETSRLERPAGTKDLQSYAIERSKNYDLDPKLVAHVMNKETGGLKDRAAAISPKGAMGVMQLMPATAREMGVKDPLDPVQNIDGGLKYLAMMGRKYGDPKLTAIAYNWGPGNTDKWLASGADNSKLPKETRNYVAGLANGGEVKRFASDGLVQEDGTSFLDTMLPTLASGKPNPLRELLRSKQYQADPGTYYDPASGETYTIASGTGAVQPYTDESKRLAGTHPKQIKSRSQMQVESSPTTPQPAPLPQMTPEAETAHLANLYPEITTETPNVSAPVEPASPAKPSGYDELRDYFTKGMTSLEDQRQRNQNLALLSAGLGMLGGTSHYAGVNIGQGGEQGVRSYMAGQKDIAAQQNALMAGRLGLEKYQSLRDIQQAQMEQLGENRKAQIETRQDAIAQREKANAINNMTRLEAQAQALAAADAKIILSNPMNLAKADDANFVNKIHSDALERRMQALYKNPSYQISFQKYHGEGIPEMPAEPSGAASGQGQWGIKLKQ